MLSKKAADKNYSVPEMELPIILEETPANYKRSFIEYFAFVIRSFRAMTVEEQNKARKLKEDNPPVPVLFEWKNQ